MILSKEDRSDELLTAYTVDYHGNVRLTKAVLAQIPSESYDFSNDDKNIYVFAKK